MYVGQHLLNAEDWGEEYPSFSPSRYTCNPVAVTGTSVGLLSILYHSPFFFAVESYHSDGEGGLNIGHSYDYKNNCHSLWKFITKLQEIHTDLQKIQNYGNQSKDQNGNKN